MISEELVVQCEEMLGYRFVNHELLKEALTHASIADDRRLSNERLEFLGDAVLGMVICHRLFELYPDYLEGDLTKLKSAVVSRSTCAAVSNSLGLTELIFVGKGMTGRAERPSSLAAGVLESIIAAIYIDGGHEAARSFILRHMEQHIAEFASTSHQQNFKSLLQQHAQQELSATPMYELVDEKGPDHSKCFEVRVVIGPQVYPSAWGAAKKQAEQRAAQLALMEMGVLPLEAVDTGAPVQTADAVPLEESAEAEGLPRSDGGSDGAAGAESPPGI